ncbi:MULTISPECIES: hypothetical protein [Comamonas]|uniref:hypothetical protein n=1 Tax=Comamonas TaxID=283 RepID=UPI00050DB0B8|nr:MULTISPECIES: hypothetical protein [Comamonas]KGH19510.1 hypothetical protein P606_23450 [Comamonas thiooxydans]GAO72165.1 hypothetical protein CSE6_020_36020 [Comamonas sp. E6]
MRPFTPQPQTRSRAWVSQLALTVCVQAIGLTAASAAVGHGDLTGSQIHAAIVGKYVTDDHHWGHKYFPNGRVERLENERLKSAHWSIKNDRLCLLQPEISKVEPICYRVVRDGQELQYLDDRNYVVFRGLVRSMPKRQ